MSTRYFLFGSDWFTSGNWLLGNIPTSSDEADIVDAVSAIIDGSEGSGAVAASVVIGANNQLTVQNGGSLTVGGNINVDSDPSDELIVNGGSVVNASQIIVGAGVSANAAGYGTVVFGGVVSNGAVAFGPSGAVNANIVLNSAGAAVIFNATDTVTYSDSISGGDPGGGGYIAIDGGTVILSGGNTYDLPTYIYSGILQIGNGGSSGSLGQFSIGIVNNGSLQYNLSAIIGTPYDIYNTISGSGSVKVTGNEDFYFLSNNTYTGITYVEAGATLVVGNDDTSGSLGTGIVDNIGFLSFQRTDAIVVGNAIEGAGDLTVDDGIVTLTGVNNYSGPTEVTLGALLKAGSSSAFGSSTLKVDSGGEVDLGGFSVSATSIGGAGEINNSSAGSVVLTVSNGQSNTFSGIIENAGGNLALALKSGLLNLTSNNSYGGGTTIAAGATLNVGNGGATGSIGQGAVIDSGQLNYDVANGSNILIPLISGSGAVQLAGGAMYINNADSVNFHGTTSVVGTDTKLVIENNESLGLGTFGQPMITDDAEIDFDSSAGIAINGLQGAGKIVQILGTTYLNGSNGNYDGLASIEGGTLVLESATALGTGAVTMSGGILQSTTNATIAGALTLALNGLETVEASGDLFFYGAFSDNVGSGGIFHIGAAAQSTGTITFDTSGGTGFVAGDKVEIDGGTLSVQSKLSWTGVSVTFVGTTGKLSLADQATAVNISSAAGSFGEVDLQTGAQADLTGGGETVNFSDTLSDSAVLINTANVWDNVAGSDGTVVLSNAQANVTGGGDTVNLIGASGNKASLSTTAGVTDKVHGSNGVIGLNDAQANLTGGSNSVYFDGNANDALSLFGTNGLTDNVFASDGKIGLDTAQANLTGGNDTVFFDGNTNDALSLFGTSGQTDNIFASGGTIGLDNAQANLTGGADKVFFDGSTNDALSLIGTNGQTDNVYASNGTIGLNNAQVNLTGGADTVFFDGNANDALSLFGTNGQGDTLYASNATIGLNNAQANLTGGANDVFFDGNTNDSLSITGTNGLADIVDGSNGALGLTNAQAGLIGSNNTVYFAGDNWISVAGGSENFVFGPPTGLETIVGFTSSDVIQLSKSDFVDMPTLQKAITQGANGATITLDANDQVLLFGVQSASLTSSNFKLV